MLPHACWCCIACGCLHDSSCIQGRAHASWGIHAGAFILAHSQWCAHRHIHADACVQSHDCPCMRDGAYTQVHAGMFGVCYIRTLDITFTQYMGDAPSPHTCEPFKLALTRLRMDAGSSCVLAHVQWRLYAGASWVTAHAHWRMGTECPCTRDDACTQAHACLT